MRKRVGGKPVRRPSLLEHLGTRHSRLLTRVLWALDGRGSACRCDDRTRLKFRGPKLRTGGAAMDQVVPRRKSLLVPLLHQPNAPPL